MNRRVNPEEIVKTVVRLTHRIEERFPTSNLLSVVRELEQVAREAGERAAANQRPLIALRLGVGVLIAAIVFAVVEAPIQIQRFGKIDTLGQLIQLLEPSIGIAFFLTAFVVFLLSLETRIKRTRTLVALHELRALAHVVDMHQLTKDPATLLPGSSRTESSPERTMTRFELARYLDYCSETLALISKIAAIYIEGFPDFEAVGAVDEIESLTTGFARKIWQKLIILQPSPELDLLSPAERGESSTEAPAPAVQHVCASE